VAIGTTINNPIVTGSENIAVIIQQIPHN